MAPIKKPAYKSGANDRISTGRQSEYPKPCPASHPTSDPACKGSIQNLYVNGLSKTPQWATYNSATTWKINQLGSTPSLLYSSGSVVTAITFQMTSACR